jgi:hypothetical protein
MAFAITNVQAYGFEIEEPVNKRYHQYMFMTITGAATDIVANFGGYIAGSLSTFWDAVDGTDIGLNALKTIRDIGTRAEYALEPQLLQGGAPYAKGAAAAAGVYSVAIANKTPGITFDTADAPTAYTVCLSWKLAPQTFPVEYNQSV